MGGDNGGAYRGKLGLVNGGWGVTFLLFPHILSIIERY